MKQLLIAGMLIISTLAFSQDTLDVHMYSKEDATLNVHIDSTQSMVAPYDECYLYLNGETTFYITVCDMDVSIFGSGCSIFTGDGYYQVNVPSGDREIKISYEGETFVFHIRNKFNN